MSNTATRLLPLLRDMQAFPVSNPNVTAVKSWPKVLQNAYNKNGWTEHAIASALLAANDQLSLLSEELASASVPNHIYQPYLQAISNAFSPILLNQTWTNTTAKFTQVHVDTIHWASIALGDQETALNADDLALLTRQADTLTELAQSESIPGTLKRILLRQASELSRAISDYPIKGIAPLRKAVNTISGDLVSESEVLKNANNSESKDEQAITGTILKSIGVVANIVDRVAKSSGSVSTIWKLSSEAFKALT